jgi:hypothetical protein
MPRARAIWGARVAEQIKDEGEAFGGAKGEPEDEEMRRATRVPRRARAGISHLARG